MRSPLSDRFAAVISRPASIFHLPYQEVKTFLDIPMVVRRISFSSPAGAPSSTGCPPLVHRASDGGDGGLDNGLDNRAGWPGRATRVRAVDSSDVRLVASDLDGTLLAPGAVVSERTARAVQLVVDRGIEMVAVTGRSHWSASEILAPVGAIRWMICSNGATLYDAAVGDVVDHQTLEQAQVEEVVTLVRDRFPSAGLAWEASDGIFHTDQWLDARRAIQPGFEPQGSTRAPAVDTARPVRKLMVAHDRLHTYEWLDALTPHLPAGLTATTSGATFVEVTHPDANKGYALGALSRRLGIDQAHTMAFGDHANDLPMLAWAGTSFAMANAHPRVQEVADHEAPHHAEDGVAQILERLL